MLKWGACVLVAAVAVLFLFLLTVKTFEKLEKGNCKCQNQKSCLVVKPEQKNNK